MMILDASALLALLQNEEGSERVLEALGQAAMSAANLSEVVSKLIQAAVPPQEVRSILTSFDLDIVPVDQEIALLAGQLITLTKPFGLSLGDRLCLATAITRQQPAMTAERIWSKIAYAGLDVISIR